MCVIIHKPANTSVHEEVLRLCWIKNSNGAGFMYAEDNKIYIKKGFMKLKDFLESYKEYESKELVIHFRLASCGEITPEMCHPFAINDELAIVHNGHITIPYLKDKNMSDSLWFVEEIFKKLPSNFLENDIYLKLITLAIGRSVMVFLDNKGKIFKIGNKEGSIMLSGCWFSNYFWLED